ncbi:MAG TPA: hypothetical protein PKI46_00145 [Bacteroidales bacterium]|nr:hypothetical protein [Bacteroidales bacterium]
MIEIKGTIKFNLANDIKKAFARISTFDSLAIVIEVEESSLDKVKVTCNNEFCGYAYKAAEEFYMNKEFKATALENRTAAQKQSDANHEEKLEMLFANDSRKFQEKLANPDRQENNASALTGCGNEIND